MSEDEINQCEREFRAFVSACDGKMEESPRGSLYWKGKSVDGYRIGVDFTRHADFVGVGAQYWEDCKGYAGEGSPCHSLEEMMETLRKYVKRYGIKKADFEQLKLW